MLRLQKEGQLLNVYLTGSLYNGIISVSTGIIIVLRIRTTNNCFPLNLYMETPYPTMEEKPIESTVNKIVMIPLFLNQLKNMPLLSVKSNF